MNRLPRFALTRTSLVVAIFILALVWSIVSALTMQRREDPGTTQRQTEVVTVWPGATSENVEQLVTKKIVDNLRSVAHVDHVEGTSRPGISVVEVVFDDGINNADAPLRDVRNKLQDTAADLPHNIAGPTIIDDIWQTYPMIVGITARGYSDRELRDVAKHLADGLSRLPDVASVSLVGEQRQQVDVDLNLHALTAYGFSATDIIGAVAARNEIVPNGTLPLSGRIVQVDPSDPLRDAADVAATLVSAQDGRVVRAGDIASVHTGYPDPPDEIVRVDGQRGIALAVKLKETSSVTDLGPSVDAFLAKARMQWPAGVHVTLVANQPQTVKERVADFLFNLILAIVVVTGLVSLFMGLRNGLLVGTTVVLSIVLTLGVMPLLHIDINQISILALIISLGIIVDAGIVAIDNIEHHLRDGDSRFDAAWRGVGELWFPLLTSTLVAMSSYVPFRLMTGAVGDFVRDLGVVTSISLVNSLLVAYFITPILGRWFAVPSNSVTTGIAGRVRSAFDDLLQRMRDAYVPVARTALEHPRTTVTIAGILLAAAIVAIPHLGVQFFPAADRNQFFIAVNAPEGTDIRRTEAIVTQIESLLAREKSVTTWGAFVGRGAPRFYYNVLSEQPKPSYAQILVDTVEVPSANALIPKLQREIDESIAGARIEVKKLEQGPPVGAPIQIRLTGDDRTSLDRASLQLQEQLRRVSGVISVRDSEGVASTTLAVKVDEDAAAASGVTDAAIADALSLAYGGRAITDIRERDRETPIVVRLNDALRNDPSAIAALGVRSSSGATVPLGEFVSFSPSTQTSILSYRDGTPEVVVLADVRGVLASDALAQFKERIASLQLPAGVHLAYAGEDEQTTKAFTSLFVALFIGLMVNQIVLIWEFRRLRLSLVVLSAVPLGLIGAVFGLAITGNHFGFVAFLGIASLGGIVTNHTIVLFEYAHREIQAGHAMEDALILAGTKRLRPIMLTVTASIAGLLPLAFSTQTLWRPMCWAIIFGLLFSMVMTLVAIPALYRLVGGEGARQSAPSPGGLTEVQPA
jgi:multidrug efflux pump subunit AcrB